MKADTVNLTALFGTDRHHVVPLFQRPYVWRREANWAPLWEDVRAAAEEVEAEESSPSTRIPVNRVARTHFLGAVVLERGPVSPGHRVPTLNVIDGQQRMTTLQVLIAAAWAEAKRRSAENPEVLLRMFLNNTEALVGAQHPEQRYKVWPSLPDREAFRALHAQELRPGVHEDHLLIQARRFFEQEIKEWLDSAATPSTRLDALVIALRERLGLVEIQLEEHDDAQVIFETLNDRGTRLRAADLVKNTLFRLAEQEGEDVLALYDLHWRPLEDPHWSEEVTTGRIKRSRIDVLLSYWLTVKTASEVPVERLFADFRIWLRETGLPASAVLADLSLHAQAMRTLNAQSGTTPSGRLLQVLGLLKTTTPIPLLLHLQAQTEVSQEQRNRCAAAIESFLVRRMACNLTTKDYNRLFLSLLVSVQAFEGTEVGEHVEQALAEQTAPSRYWPDDGEFISSLLGENIDRVLKGPRLRVLLGGMEAALRLDKSEMGFVPANVERLSVEHLLPQQWTSHYPLPDDAEADALERRERAVHRLGNLTLTTTKLNSSVSNGPWSIKRRELNQHAVLLLTAGSVLQAPPSLEERLALEWAQSWDEQRIDRRGLYLTSLALRAWPRPETTEAFEATRDKREEAPNDLQAAVSRGATRYGDIAGHIAAAFRDLAVGAFLTISEIAKSESDIYPDAPPSQGAIAARLFPSSGRCTVPGVRPAVGPTGVRGAYKT